jgi:peptidoglycan-associated lipoprotein
MQKQLWMKLAMFFLMAALVMAASCTKKTMTATKEPYSTLKEEATSTKKTAATGQETILPAEMPKAGSDKMAKNFMPEDIYFEFDKSTLTPEARSTLIEVAAWLSDNSDTKLVIEGYCDERGTPEYNLALGDRRAESAKAFLADLGISIPRLTTISYGEERPVDSGHNEQAWAKNRRAHFVVD